MMNAKTHKIDYQQAVVEMITVGDWIRFATSSFERSGLCFGHGTDNAWDEAVRLVLAILHLPPEADVAVFSAKVLSSERLELVAAMQRRIADRVPVPYITHEAWCMGLPFYVDERVLIPRSPIAEWIEKQFEPFIDSNKVRSILEIGTGSGCLAIASALNFPDAEIDAVDISEDALAVATINVRRHEMEDQVHLIQSDCFQNLNGQKYDIIISNPPYVGETEMATLPQEYRHEPSSALQADDEGFAIVLEIIAVSEKYLNKDGILVVEVGNSQWLLHERLPQLPFTWLEQEHGGHGLFVLTKKQLSELRN